MRAGPRRSRLPAGAWLVCCALGAAWVTPPARASAAEPAASRVPPGSGARPPVRVEGDECAVAPLDEVITVLRVELPSRLAEGSVTGRAYEVAIECLVDAVALRVGAPARPNRTYRTNLRGAPPNVRARIVALAIAEIVRDLDRDAEGAAPAPVTPSPPREPAPVPAGARDASPRAVAYPRAPVELGALAQASTFRFDGRWLVGAGLRFEYAAAGLCAGGDAVLLATDQRFDFGTAQTLLTYASPYAGWSHVEGALRVRLGAGYAVGAARLAGRATDTSFNAATVSGLWSAPYAFAALAFAIGASLRIDARAQAGWVASPVVGEVPRAGDIRLEGLWTSGQIGVALGL